MQVADKGYGVRCISEPVAVPEIPVGERLPRFIIGREPFEITAPRIIPIEPDPFALCERIVFQVRADSVQVQPAAFGIQRQPGIAALQGGAEGIHAHQRPQIQGGCRFHPRAEAEKIRIRSVHLPGEELLLLPPVSGQLALAVLHLPVVGLQAFVQVLSRIGQFARFVRPDKEVHHAGVFLIGQEIPRAVPAVMADIEWFIPLGRTAFLSGDLLVHRINAPSLLRLGEDFLAGTLGGKRKHPQNGKRRNNPSVHIHKNNNIPQKIIYICTSLPSI